MIWPTYLLVLSSEAETALWALDRPINISAAGRDSVPWLDEEKTIAGGNLCKLYTSSTHSIIIMYLCSAIWRASSSNLIASCELDV